MTARPSLERGPAPGRQGARYSLHPGGRIRSPPSVPAPSDRRWLRGPLFLHRGRASGRPGRRRGGPDERRRLERRRLERRRVGLPLCAPQTSSPGFTRSSPSRLTPLPTRSPSWSTRMGVWLASLLPNPARSTWSARTGTWPPAAIAPCSRTWARSCGLQLVYNDCLTRGSQKAISRAAASASAAPKMNGAPAPKPPHAPAPCHSTPAMAEAGNARMPSTKLYVP